jgi:hypothetical protein
LLIQRLEIIFVTLVKFKSLQYSETRWRARN